jgi:hypothetical protein
MRSGPVPSASPAGEVAEERGDVDREEVLEGGDRLGVAIEHTGEGAEGGGAVAGGEREQPAAHLLRFVAAQVDADDRAGASHECGIVFVEGGYGGHRCVLLCVIGRGRARRARARRAPYP